ncbi:hypothetical protein CVS47_02556 [Microbacterium lemovicicum]|uniref:DUF1275 family protein n=1 Tax=Microbacterium lemovicicum TaxID=1072463 RepID=A0A3S9WCU9_9MICO|nr:YoaK family protein [Microbacterium lemovicicum]AZS37909.1 hypothetical protein CVS47_02556 [Microbacterium lemovicicum]
MTSTVSTERRRYPLLERPSAAIALAVAAGLLNAWTFGHTQTFATVQSGNIVSIGYFVVAGDMGRVGIAAISVLAFFAGACVCSILILWLARSGRAYSLVVLACETVLLMVLAAVATVGAVDPWWIAWSISFLAGMQGNAFHRETGMLYGNVAVTLVVQMAGSLLGRAIGAKIASDGQPHLRPAGGFLLILLGFAAGGAAGCAVDPVWTSGSLVAAAAVLAVLAGVAATRRGPVDPAQNAPTP